MTKKILSSFLFSAITLISFAQMPSFLWKVENSKLVNPTTYQFDVYMYNTGESEFELRGGTIALNVNPAWKNGGTIEVSITSSELVTSQQRGNAMYNVSATDYLRKIINSVSKGAGTSIAAHGKVKCFTIQLTNTVAFSTKAKPKFVWKFDNSPGAGFNCSGGANAAAITVVAMRGSEEVISNQKNCVVIP
jgi:hypothetical protein